VIVPFNLKKISLDRKLQDNYKTGVKVEKQAKIDQVMGPETLLTFESPWSWFQIWQKKSKV